MCTIVLMRDAHPRYPLVVAANRDEFLARAAEGPQVLAPGIVGGRDLEAGGTWLAVRADGFFAAVTNQRPAGPVHRAPRSRGELPVGALQQGRRADVERWLRGLPVADFNPFNLVFGDAHRVQLAYGRPDGLSFAEVPPGISVLPSDVLDSPAFPKVQRARALLSGGVDDLASLATVLADHHAPEPVPAEPAHLDEATRRAVHALCVHTPVYGTRSVTLLALEPGRVARYLFADGPACRSPLRDVTSIAGAPAAR